MDEHDSIPLDRRASKLAEAVMAERKAKDEARQEAHSRLSEQLSQSIVQIAKDGARPHQIKAALARCAHIRTQYENFNCIDLKDLEYIESQLRAMS